MIVINHVIKMNELGCFEWLVFSKINSCRSRIIHDLATGFRAKLGCKKFESEHLKEVESVSPIGNMFVIYFPRKIDGKIISETHSWINIQHKNRRRVALRLLLAAVN